MTLMLGQYSNMIRGECSSEDDLESEKRFLRSQEFGFMVEVTNTYAASWFCRLQFFF